MKEVILQVPSTKNDVLELVSSKSNYELEKLGSYIKTDYGCKVIRLLRDILNIDVIKKLSNRRLESLSYFVNGVLGRPKYIGDADLDYMPVDSPYRCIPLSTFEFLNLLVEVSKYLKLPIKFIDAGAGVGDKIYLADLVFGCLPYNNEAGDLIRNEFRGVELSRHIINYGVYKYNYNRDTILLNGDITTFDFKPYNFIYAYNPINGTKGMFEFFKNVHKTAEKGTICMFVNVGSGHCAMEKFDPKGNKFKQISKKRYEIYEVI